MGFLNARRFSMKAILNSILLLFFFSVQGCGTSSPVVDDEAVETPIESNGNSSSSVIVKTDKNGLKGDGVFYWGTLAIEPIAKNQSRITYTGNTTPFYKEMVGMEFVSSRIHKNPNVYPAQGDNYFPGLKTCRYAKVLKVESGTSLIVNFAYNGGDIQSPKKSTNVDGYFFTDNRAAFKKLIESTARNEEVVLEDGKVYILKGMPNAELKKSILLKRSGTGKNKPILMMSIEDGFDNDKDGNGTSATFTKTFGGKNFFVLPNNNNNCIIKGIDICPTVYTVSVVQYGIGYDYFWYDPENKSSQKRTCSIIDCDIDAVKKIAIKELGKERQGMTWDLPILAKSMNGGMDDGNDITALSEYSLYNTSWRSRYVMILKSKDRAGILFKVVGDDPKKSVQLTENLKVKSTSFDDIPILFKTVAGHTIAEVNSDSFNWYLVANQDWNGGTSGNFKTFNKIDVNLNGKTQTLYFHNNADFVELNSEKRVFIDGKNARLFDVFPIKGDAIKPWKKESNTGIFRKVDDNTFDIWGYQLFEGDILAYNGNNYTIKKREYRTKDKTLTSSFIHYWRVTLSGPPIKTNTPTFTVVQSINQELMNGQFKNCKVYVDRDEVGHLFYTNGGVNMYLENVETFGYWRSSGGGIGTPKYLYEAASQAYFKNVVTDDKGGIGKEWAPSFLKNRELKYGDKFRLIYDGGNMVFNQTQKDVFNVEFRNKPVLHGKFISPKNGDDKGFTPDPEGKGIAITLYDGDSFSLKNIKGQAVHIYAYGKCTLNIDGYEGQLIEIKKKGQSPRMNGITIQKADATTQLTIVGNGGKAPIRCSAKEIKNSAQLKIQLINWGEIGEYYTNKFISLPFDEKKDANFSKNIKAKGNQGQNLIKGAQ